jgi:predicted RNA-binding protein with PUA-like domain
MRATYIEGDMNYWLFKSEPDVYGIDHLAAGRTTVWDGVRNYQARNYLRSAEVGDLVIFYHSNSKPPGIAGLARVIAARIPDPSQFDPDSKYFDSKSNPDDPRWITVEVEFVEKFPTYLPLDGLREQFSGDELILVRTGSRLSVMPVTNETALRILDMARS